VDTREFSNSRNFVIPQRSTRNAAHDIRKTPENRSIAIQKTCRSADRASLLEGSLYTLGGYFGANIYLTRNLCLHLTPRLVARPRPAHRIRMARALSRILVPLKSRGTMSISRCLGGVSTRVQHAFTNFREPLITPEIHGPSRL
jgi:hypothetical protein